MKWLIAGLGNPGKDYEKHRHTIGFHAIEALREAFDASGFKIKGQLMVSEGKFNENSIVFCCPTTFMNLSGQAIAPLIKYSPEMNLVVIHDDLDLPCGQIRFKHSGGTGGHNGLKNIHQYLGDKYRRIRIGIGHPGNKDLVSHYVLSAFNKSEKELIDKAIDYLVSAFSLLLDGKEELFTQTLHNLK